MSPRQVRDFIRYHGVVLQAAKGLEPSLADRIAGETIRGSWWGHRAGQQIFDRIQDVHKSSAVLACTLAGGKITFIHRRLWPAFVRLADEFPPHALDRVREVHLPSGRHVRDDVAFPDWIPEPVAAAALKLSRADARRAIGTWLDRYGIRRR